MVASPDHGKIQRHWLTWVLVKILHQKACVYGEFTRKTQNPLNCCRSLKRRRRGGNWLGKNLTLA